MVEQCADGNEAILQEMQLWYQVGRKVVDPRTGALIQLSGDACSLKCVTVLAVKLAVPPQAPEPEDNIDLASLRAASFQQPN